MCKNEGIYHKFKARRGGYTVSASLILGFFVVGFFVWLF